MLETKLADAGGCLAIVTAAGIFSTGEKYLMRDAAMIVAAIGIALALFSPVLLRVTLAALAGQLGRFGGAVG